MKRSFLLFTCAVLLASVCLASSFAADVPSEKQQSAIDELTVCGVELKAALTKRPDMGYLYVDENDRTMVPLRLLAEAMGLEVAWDQTEQTATILGGANGAVAFAIGSAWYTVDRQTAVMDTTPVVFAPGRIHVPLRFVAEAVGATLRTEESDGFRIFVSAVPDVEEIPEVSPVRAELLSTLAGGEFAGETGALFTPLWEGEALLLFSETGKILRVDLEKNTATEIPLPNGNPIRSCSFQVETELLLINAFTKTDGWALIACRLDGSEVWRKPEAKVWGVSAYGRGWVYNTDTSVIFINEYGVETGRGFELPPGNEIMLLSGATDETVTLGAFSSALPAEPSGSRLTFDWSGNLTQTRHALLWEQVVGLDFDGDEESCLIGLPVSDPFAPVAAFDIVDTDISGNDERIKSVRLPEEYVQSRNVLTGSIEAGEVCYVFGVTYRGGAISNQFFIAVNRELKVIGMGELQLGKNRAVICGQADKDGTGIKLVTTYYGEGQEAAPPELWWIER